MNMSRKIGGLVNSEILEYENDIGNTRIVSNIVEKRKIVGKEKRI